MIYGAVEHHEDGETHFPFFVVDSRVEAKVVTKVSARLTNVPVDTAVRILCDMAGLSVVRIDNVFYVTSAENAQKVANEKAKRGLFP